VSVLLAIMTSENRPSGEESLRRALVGAKTTLEDEARSLRKLLGISER
jgi:hypothetical protein